MEQRVLRPDWAVTSLTAEQRRALGVVLDGMMDSYAALHDSDGKCYSSRFSSFK
ncbi:unnamed protein product [Protopolystoma xenopodis]|uniref:Uncharacterized protein n=1 Tax=Protopolystoma xenopodis TaxID=117903 RepID=A0A448WZP3_9PLAT|nr:unnamed protein product [Protopolystoma xenopodis]